MEFCFAVRQSERRGGELAEPTDEFATMFLRNEARVLRSTGVDSTRDRMLDVHFSSSSLPPSLPAYYANGRNKIIPRRSPRHCYVASIEIFPWLIIHLSHRLPR